MSDQVERIAKAIAAADGYDSWDTAHERTVLHYSTLARAAIEAMKPQVSPEFDWLANVMFGPAGPIPPYPR